MLKSHGQWWVFLLVSFVLMLPAFAHLPDTDSGSFAYIGKLVSEGGVPYRDGWENKSPLIFFLNAACVWLSPNYLFGINVLSILGLATGFSLIFNVASNKFGARPAFAGIVCGFLSVHAVVRYGNFTELFAFTLHSLSWVVFFSKSIPLHKKMWWLGVLLAGCGLLKGNLIGTPLLLGFFIWLKNSTSLRMQILCHYVAGSILTCLPFLIYFWIHDSLMDVYDATVVANFSIVGMAPSLTRQLSNPGFWEFLRLAPLAVICFMIGIYKYRHNSSERNTAAVLAICFATEYLLSGISGKGFYHYYITCLPGIVFGTALFVNSLPKSKFIMPTIIALSFTIILLRDQPTRTTLYNHKKIVKAALGLTPELIPNDELSLIEYLNQSVIERDKVFIIGQSGRLHLATNTTAPTTHFLQYHFLQCARSITKEYEQDWINTMRATKGLTIVIDDIWIDRVLSPAIKQQFFQMTKDVEMQESVRFGTYHVLQQQSTN